MPVAHGELEMVAHRFAHDERVGVVMAEGKRIAAAGAFKLDLADFLILFHDKVPFRPASRAGCTL